MQLHFSTPLEATRPAPSPLVILGPVSDLCHWLWSLCVGLVAAVEHFFGRAGHSAVTYVASHRRLYNFVKWWIDPPRRWFLWHWDTPARPAGRQEAAAPVALRTEDGRRLIRGIQQRTTAPNTTQPNNAAPTPSTTPGSSSSSSSDSVPPLSSSRAIQPALTHHGPAEEQKEQGNDRADQSAATRNPASTHSTGPPSSSSSSPTPTSAPLSSIALTVQPASTTDDRPEGQREGGDNPAGPTAATNTAGEAVEVADWQEAVATADADDGESAVRNRIAVLKLYVTPLCRRLFAGQITATHTGSHSCSLC